MKPLQQFRERVLLDPWGRGGRERFAQRGGNSGLIGTGSDMDDTPFHVILSRRLEKGSGMH